MAKHDIFYITNIQSSWRYPPPFPFENNYKLDFNVLTIEGLCDIPVTPTTLVQEICVCSRSSKYSDGYGKVRIPSYHGLPFTPAFAVGPVVPLTVFATTYAYKMKTRQYYIPDPKSDLCKIALEHGVLLSDIKNYDKELALYAIKKNTENIDCLSDEIIDDEIREYVRKIGNPNQRVFKIRPILIAAPPSPINREAITNSTRQLAKDYVNDVMTTDTLYHSYHSYLFDTLYIVKDVFTEWLCNYKKLPETCSFRLDSIGYCDEHNVLHPLFKKHLGERSQQRLNITQACCVKTDDPTSLEHVVADYPQIFEFLEFMGFEVHVYVQTFYRRGRDISVVDIKNKDEWIRANYLSVFLINPKIPDTCIEETRLGDGLCLSD